MNSSLIKCLNLKDFDRIIININEREGGKINNKHQAIEESKNAK